MIEVGEYIRTRKGITKIKKTSKECSLCENSLIVNNETHKHSKNIIDLIEVGDIVELINGLNKKEFIRIQYLSELDIIKSHKIISILTHELYEQNSYKVVE